VADSPKFDKSSRYTEDRGIAGAFPGETVTRRRFMEGTVLVTGGIATMAFTLPALGFALGPIFEDTTPTRWERVGPTDDFNDETYVPRVINLIPEVGDPGKTTIYVRRFNPERDKEVEGQDTQPYVAISTRCAHAGCPVRYIQASQKFVCPCHGGVYGFEGNGQVEVGDRFSLDSELKRFSPRDPGNHLDGLWQYIYPSRPTT
jgi:menaquinol-cytochrome c reductase iron-sulfur subunit